MKRVFLGAFAFMTVFASAQLRYGIKGGLTGSNLIEKYDNEKSHFVNGTKLSFYGGGLVEYKFKPNWAVQGELLYNNVGYKYESKNSYTNADGTVVSSTDKNDISANLITLPLSIKYYANQDFNVSVGVNLGYFISGDYTRDNSGGTKKKTDIFNKDAWGQETARFYTGPFVGAEYNFKNGLFIDGRYNWGITDFKVWNSKNNDKEFQNFFQFGIGYKFN